MKSAWAICAIPMILALVVTCSQMGVPSLEKREIDRIKAGEKIQYNVERSRYEVYQR